MLCVSVLQTPDLATTIVCDRDKYVGKREGVMEEMEIVAAGLETVIIYPSSCASLQLILLRKLRRILVKVSMPSTRRCCGT